MSDLLYIHNSNLVELRGLRRASDLTYLNGAQVEVTLFDAAGREVSGQTWPALMEYVAGSDGDYRAVLTHGVGVVLNRLYNAQITAWGEDDLKGTWNKVLRAGRRGID